MPRTGEVFIQIKDGRVLVSRYLPFTDGYVTWEAARNAAELEVAARRELERAGVDLDGNGHHCCSHELGLRAEFEPLYRV